METRRPPYGVIFLTVFLDIVGFAIVLPLFPSMLEHYLGLEGEGSWLGWALQQLAGLSGSQSEENVQTMFGAGLMGSYSILQFLFAPYWGGLSDRLGRRPVLLFTVAGIAVSYLLWVLSGSFLVLVAARLLGGLMSGNISTATAAIADSTTPEDRPKGMGLVGAAIGLGFTLGPLIGVATMGLRLDHLLPSLVPLGLHPFSAAAAVSFLLACGNWLWLWRRFEETLPAAQRGQGQTWRTANPLRMFQRVPHAGVNTAYWAYFLYFVGFTGMEATLTFLAKHRLGFEVSQIGYMFLYFGLIVVFVQGGVIRQLAPVYGEKRLTVAGLIVLLPGFLVLAFTQRVGQLYLGVGLVAFGSAFVTPSLSSLVSLYTPATEQGRVLGVFRSLGALARATGPFAAGILYWRYGSSSPYLAAALVTVVPLVLVLRLPAPPPGQVPPAH